MSKINVGIAEDRAMFRKGLVQILNESKDFKVCIEAEDGFDFLENLKKELPDVVLMDFQMPGINGAETIKRTLKQHPDIQFIMLSNFDDEEIIIESLEAGAKGYITKEEDINEIFEAIQSVYLTGYYVNDRTSKHLVADLVKSGKIKPNFNREKDFYGLTDTEIEVIRLMGKELTTREIADRLFKGVRTVEGYKSSIMEKTGTRNACGVVMFGVKIGIINL